MSRGVRASASPCQHCLLGTGPHQCCVLQSLPKLCGLVRETVGRPFYFKVRLVGKKTSGVQRTAGVENQSQQTVVSNPPSLRTDGHGLVREML